VQAVVTGASSGIGEALARRLAAEGCDLVLVARRRDRLEALATELRALGRSAEVVAADLASDEGWRAVLEVAPAPDVLVNNAGLGVFGPTTGSDPVAQLRMVQVNCEALTALTLAVLPRLVERGSGVVVNMASIAAFQPVPFYAVYGASKAFVLSLSEALDQELLGTGVRVVAVCPGPVPTEFQAVAGSPDARQTHGLALRTSEQVADATWRAIRRHRRVVIPAPLHRWMWFLQRLVPRRWVAAITGRSMRKHID